MPHFSLELTVPADIPEACAKSTFYWSSDNSHSFESTYGPGLGGLGPVSVSNIDFVRLAVAAYTADRTTPRKRGGSNWNRRDIGLTVPVHTPDRWRSVNDDLESLFGMLTGDRWRLEFVHTNVSDEPVAKVDSRAERVVLLSGGADSAVGALKSGQDVGSGGQILVSHVGAKILAPVQRDVASAVQNIVSSTVQEHLQILFCRKSRQVEGTRFPSEPSSRSRSLLFLAFGLAVASRNGVPLWIPENGFSSLNPPLGPERRGSLSTRTTHPAFLEGLAMILGKAEAHNIIVNPFSGQTKGEMFADVADLLGREEASRFLSLTHSCGHTGQRSYGISVRRQCGVCFNCMLRKASFRASGVTDRSSYIDAGDANVRTWLQTKSVESSIQTLVRRGIRSRDIVVMGLPSSYPASDALSLCQRALDEFRTLYSS